MKSAFQFPAATSQFDPRCLDIAPGGKTQGGEQSPRDQSVNLVSAIDQTIPNNPEDSCTEFPVGGWVWVASAEDNKPAVVPVGGEMCIWRPAIQKGCVCTALEFSQVPD